MSDAKLTGQQVFNVLSDNFNKICFHVSLTFIKKLNDLIKYLQWFNKKIALIWIKNSSIIKRMNFIQIDIIFWDTIFISYVVWKHQYNHSIHFNLWIFISSDWVTSRNLFLTTSNHLKEMDIVLHYVLPIALHNLKPFEQLYRCILNQK